MLDTIRKNPSTISKYLQEPRMLQCIGVILDMPLVDTVANTQIKREQFTISSDEESEEESDDDTDDDGDDATRGSKSLPKPLSKTRPPPKSAATNQPAVYEDGLLKGLPIQEADAPRMHRIPANDPNAELRKGVAEKLGATRCAALPMLARAHRLMSTPHAPITRPTPVF
jgi:hypothetical protein